MTPNEQTHHNKSDSGLPRLSISWFSSALICMYYTEWLGKDKVMYYTGISDRIWSEK